MSNRSKKAQYVLPKNQQACKALVEEFSSTHILVWGTALSLQLWHRQSIDFDLFSFGPQWSWKELMGRVTRAWYTPDPNRSTLLRLSDEEQSEATFFVEWVKIQVMDFSRNPFDVVVSEPPTYMIEWTIRSIDLLHLWAMKVYAMMYRAKRKDAVDVAMLLREWYTLEQMIACCKWWFGKLYQPKATIETIREDGRDMSEQVHWILVAPPSDDEIKGVLKAACDEWIVSCSGDYQSP